MKVKPRNEKSKGCHAYSDCDLLKSLRKSNCSQQKGSDDGANRSTENKQEEKAEGQLWMQAGKHERRPILPLAYRKQHKRQRNEKCAELKNTRKAPNLECNELRSL